MSESTRPVIVASQRGSPGCVITVLWFVFVGWWLSAIWITVAWFLMVLVVTMPLAFWMIDRLPRVATLREPTVEYHSMVEGTSARVQVTSIAQRAFIVRVVWFLIVGWWFSLLWMWAAWAASATFIGIPLAIWMFNRVPAITTLRRY
jgi:uncharacterized membrane protein YccF (DUF307 family)